MNINHLKMFSLVVDEGSISQAARVSYVSQPAVTNQIKQLENYYETDLFTRSDAGLILTEAGSKLYPFAKEMIDHLERSEEAVKSIQDTYMSTLRIGASLTIGEYFLPRILGQFQRKQPTSKTSLFIGNTSTIMDALENLDIDLALVEGAVEANKELHIRKFSQDEIIFVVPRDHEWTTRKTIDIHEMMQEQVIWREKNAGIRKIIEHELGKHEIQIPDDIQMELGSTQAIKSAIEAGLGIGILPKLSVEQELKLGTLKQVSIADVKWMRDLFIVTKRSRFPKQTVRAFISFIMENRS